MTYIAKIPPGIGTHRDQKFRQLIARRISSARFSLFQDDGASSSGAIAREDLVVAEFSSPIFTTPGDTVVTTASGGFTPNANNKQIHFLVEDEAAVGFAGYDSPVYTVAAGTIRWSLVTHTKFNASHTLHSETIFMSNTAGAPGVFIDHSGFLPPYEAKKTKIKLQSTGGAANDVFIYNVWMEFLPGFLG